MDSPTNNNSYNDNSDFSKHSILIRIIDTVGLLNTIRASSDVHWLMLAKLLRMVAFGQVALILALYLKAIGLTEQEAGIFMGLTLAGDVIISLLVSFVADRIGRRTVVRVGSLLMAASGLMFAITENFYLLLFASIIGVISPSGVEVGPFRAIEESSLAHLSVIEHRSDIYAWYTLLGAFGGALGSISGGWIIELSQSWYKLDVIESYKLVFVSYMILGLLKWMCNMLLTSSVELESDVSAEREPLLGSNNNTDNSSSPPKRVSFIRSLIPTISHESKKIVFLLTILFAVDSFGSSLGSLTWISYYIKKKFDITEGVLGTIFFSTSVVAALTSLGGSIISKWLGPLLTMVITHLPSSALIAFIPLPSTLTPTLTILIVRACTQSMDVAPRQAFLSAVVLNSERTAVMAWVNVVKTISQMLGPWVVGTLTGYGKQWICFVMAGSLKVAYDLGIFGFFLRVQLDRDRHHESI